MTDTDAPRFKRGDLVRLKHRPADSGTIHGAPRALGGTYRYSVVIAGRVTYVPEDDLEPLAVETSDPRELFLAGSFGERDAAVVYLTYLRVTESLSNYVYSFQNSRTQFFPHQFKPLLKLLDGADRLLVADEVGLGKTIEAGLILLELKARRQLTRALVVCPANLREKWRRELLHRFDLDFQVHKPEGMIAALDRVRTNPATPLLAIVSYETARSESVRQAFDSFEFELDLLVADEAHRMRNEGTETYETATVLARLARHVVLLTATPINNRSEDLFNQLHLLDPDLFDSEAFFDELRIANEHVVAVERLLRRKPPLARDEILAELTSLEGATRGEHYRKTQAFQLLREVVTKAPEHPDRELLVELQRLANRLNFLTRFVNRTRRIDIDEARPIREPHLVKIDATPEELALYRAVYELALRHFNDFRFPVITMERSMASCMPAFIRRYGQAAASPEESPEARFEEGDDDVGADASLIPGLDAVLAKFGAPILKNRVDSKVKHLLEALEQLEREQPGRKVIVFSFFRHTIRYLEAVLRERGVKSVVIHGGVPSDPTDPARDERERRRKLFERDPAIRVMLSSEVGSEGLDFQFAHVVINYDLPWNPMVVEQRIGRIDRIGQKSPKLLVYSLVLAETIDEAIYERLLTKIGIFEQSIGDIEAILGNVVNDMRAALFSNELTDADRQRQIDNAADVLVHKKKNLEEVEKGANKIVGTDQYVRDEIERIRTGRRFVGGGELEVFVHELFRHGVFKLDIEADGDAVFRARLTERVRAFFARHLDDSLPANMFRGRLQREEMRWTFSQDLADADASIELFNVNHPLVRALCAYVASENGALLAPNFRVALPATEEFPADHAYVLALNLVEFGGGTKPRKELVAFVHDVTDDKVLTASAGDRLLAEVLVHGRELGTAPPWSRESADAILNNLDERVFHHVGKRRAEIQDEEADYVERRREQIAAQHERSVKVEAERKAKLATHLAHETEGARRRQLKNLIEGADTRIKNSERRRDELLLAIPKAPRISATTRLMGAGLVITRGGAGRD